MSTPDDKIWATFKYCSDAFASVGHPVSFPPNTDPKTTYKWRYLKRFHEQVTEMGLSSNSIFKIAVAMALEAKKKGHLRRKGMAILASDNLLEVGCKLLEAEDKAQDNIIDRIVASRKFVESLDNPIDRMISSASDEALPNIVMWHMDGSISTVYLSISKTCNAAMRKIDKDDRKLLPDAVELIKARRKVEKPARLKARVRAMMGNDWIYQGV